jgi:hypothetical protein
MPDYLTFPPEQPMRVRCSLIAILLIVTSAAHAGEQYDGRMKSNHLACIDLEDAENLIHFAPTQQFPNFKSFLLGMQESQRCLWWRKGDELIVSGRNIPGGEDVVAARRPPDSRYLFVDKCSVEGAPCP